MKTTNKLRLVLPMSYLFTLFLFTCFCFQSLAQRGGSGDPGGGGHTVPGANGRQLFDRVDRLSKVRIELMSNFPEYTEGAALLLQKVERFMPLFGFELQEAAFKKSWFFSRTPFACRLETFVQVQEQQTAACQNNLEIRIFLPEWEILDRETRVELIVHEIVRSWSPRDFPEASLRKVVEAIIFSENEIDFASEIEEIPEMRGRPSFIISSRLVSKERRQAILDSYYNHMLNLGHFYCSNSFQRFAPLEAKNTEEMNVKLGRYFFQRDSNVITPEYTDREWPHFKVGDVFILHVNGNDTSQGFPTYLRHVFAESSVIRRSSRTDGNLGYEELFALSSTSQVLDQTYQARSWMKTLLASTENFNLFYDVALERCTSAGYPNLFMHAAGIFICHNRGDTKEMSKSFVDYRSRITHRDLSSEGQDQPPTQSLVSRMTTLLNEELFSRLTGRINLSTTTLTERCSEFEENVQKMKRSNHFVHTLRQIKRTQK